MTEASIILISMIIAQVYVLMLEPRYLLDWLCVYIERLPKKLQKLLTCSTCMAGQLSLWAYCFIDDYNIILHIVTVSVTIWITHLSNKMFYD